VIAFKEAIREIDKRDFRDGNGSFALVFMTCDVNRKTGGELISLVNACKCGLPPNCKTHDMRGIKDLETGKKYAVHNRLIFQYNKQEIYWV